MASANLTAQRLREVLDYNPDTGVFTWRMRPKRGRVQAGDMAGSTRPDGYFHIGVDGTRYLAHRLAFLYMTGQWPDFQIDHKNIHPSDTRWKNLRPVTPVQQQQNKHAYKNNRSGFRGVFKKRSRWIAKIMINRQSISAGSFATVLEAYAARLELERIHFTHSPACSTRAGNP